LGPAQLSFSFYFMAELSLKPQKRKKEEKSEKN
jgi:hypothetical protein